MAKQETVTGNAPENSQLSKNERGPQGPRFSRRRETDQDETKNSAENLEPDAQQLSPNLWLKFLNRALARLKECLITTRFEVITGTSNRALAEEIAKILQKKLNSQGTVGRFSDGEERVALAKTPKIVGNHIFIIQSTSPPDVAHYFMELCVLIDAIRRASASKISVVMPYYGYARQDRKDNPKVPITASMTAKILQAIGVNSILTLDLHAEQTQGAFDGPWDNLYASKVLIPELLTVIDPKKTVVVAPDMGRAKRARAWNERMGTAGVAIIDKNRDAQGVEAMNMTGQVAGFDVIISDDMIASAGTIVEAAKFCKKQGAGRIFVVATHGLFVKEALAKLNTKWIDGTDLIEGVFVTDTIEHRQEVVEDPKIKIVSVAKLIAEAIWRIYTGEEMGDLID